MKIWIVFIVCLCSACTPKTRIQQQVNSKILDGYQCLNGIDDSNTVACSVCKKDDNLVIIPQELKACKAGGIYRHAIN